MELVTLLELCFQASTQPLPSTCLPRAPRPGRERRAVRESGSRGSRESHRGRVGRRPVVLGFARTSRKVSSNQSPVGPHPKARVTLPGMTFALPSLPRPVEPAVASRLQADGISQSHQTHRSKCTPDVPPATPRSLGRTFRPSGEPPRAPHHGVAVGCGLRVWLFAARVLISVWGSPPSRSSEGQGAWALGSAVLPRFPSP